MKSQLLSTLREVGVVRGNLTISVAEDIAAFYALKKDWLDIESRSSNPMTYFQSFDWCEKWTRLLGPDIFKSGGKLHIAIICKDNKLVALLPLTIEKRRGLIRVLRFLGEPLLQYGMVLKDQSLIDAGELRACIECIISDANCDAMYLDHLIEGSPLHSSLKSGFAPGLASHASIVSLERYESSQNYVASLSRQQRKSRNRKRRKLQQLGKLTTTIVHGDRPEFMELIDTAIEQKSTWLKMTGMPESRINDPRVKQMLRELGGNEGNSSGALAFVLHLEGKPIAIEIGFWRNRHYYSYLGSFDWDKGAYSPGKLLLEDAICWTIDNGFESYDLLGHPSQYKESIANVFPRILVFTRSKTLLGSCYALIWRPLIKPTVKQGIKAIPAYYRQQIFRMAAPFLGR